MVEVKCIQGGDKIYDLFSQNENKIIFKKAKIFAIK